MLSNKLNILKWEKIIPILVLAIIIEVSFVGFKLYKILFEASSLNVVELVLSTFLDLKIIFTSYLLIKILRAEKATQM